jgi:hypothetical protein
MLKTMRLSDLRSKLEACRDALVFSGGVIFFLCICAVTLAGFHNRDLSIHGSAQSVSMMDGAGPRSNP